MPVYVYKARDSAGKSVSGTMEAASKAETIDKLQKMGYMTTQVTESLPGIKLESFFEKLKRISSDDMLMFYIQLSNMINAGITVMMSLSILGKQVDNTKLREIVGSVGRQVEAGSNLSQAFASHPAVFSRLFINMIKVGEATGSLDTVLLRYARFSENQEDLKQKVKGALFYPIILLCAGIAVMLLIVTTIIPKFAELYLSAGVTLPTPTLLVYNAGIAIKRYWYIIVIAAALAIFGLRYYFITERGGLFFDRLRLRLPVVGPLYRKIIVARITRTLATLLASGVAILESLDIVKEVAGNRVIRRVIENVRKYVEKGERMAEPLRVSEEFPHDVVQMVSVGEETGHLDEMLNKIADFYDMTIGYAVKKLTTIIEPVFLVIMGGMVGLIMASMLMPIFDMVKILKH